MLSIRLDARALFAALTLSGALAGAQQNTQSATVAVSLRVLPQASFEGGAQQRFSAGLVPGEPLHVHPAAGVRTRITYDATTKVIVTGTSLRGPGGPTIHVRYVCEFGGGTTATVAAGFDCAGGLVAGRDGARTTSLPLAVGAELSGVESLDVPPGLYTGRVTLTATHPAY